MLCIFEFRMISAFQNCSKFENRTNFGKVGNPRVKPSWVEPSRVGPSRIGPSQAKLNQIELSQAELSWVWAKLSQVCRSLDKIGWVCTKKMQNIKGGVTSSQKWKAWSWDCHTWWRSKNSIKGKKPSSEIIYYLIDNGQDRWICLSIRRCKTFPIPNIGISHFR